MPVPTDLTHGNVSVLTNQQERTDNDASGSVIPRVTTGDRSGQLISPVASRPIAPTSPAANLTASTDTVYTFPNTDSGMWNLRRVLVENNSDRGATPADVYVNFDAAASPGTSCLRPGQWRSYDVPVAATVHLYSTQALAVNGSAAGGCVLLGWL